MIKPPVCRLVLLQFTASTALGLIFTGWQGFTAGYSALLGGLIICIANVWFFWRVFCGRTSTAESEPDASGVVLGRYYLAETGRILIVALLLAAVLADWQGASYIAVEPKALFAGLFVVLFFSVVSTARELSKQL